MNPKRVLRLEDAVIQDCNRPNNASPFAVQPKYLSLRLIVENPNQKPAYQSFDIVSNIGRKRSSHSGTELYREQISGREQALTRFEELYDLLQTGKFQLTYGQNPRQTKLVFQNRTQQILNT